jgi:asparagine synthase (glutamine-hydrolysing)
MRGLTEKFILKKLGRAILPEIIWSRPKRPYRAPIHRSFFNESTEDYVKDLLSPEAIRSAGFFKPAAVAQLTRKIESGAPIGETDDMALAGIISTQLVHHQFVRDFQMAAPLSPSDDVKVCLGTKGNS